MGNADAAKGAYQAFSQGDLETLKEGFAEDAEWQTSDELPLGGVTRGRDAIMENFAQLPNYWSSFSVEPSEFIEAGDKVIIQGHAARHRQGRQLRGSLPAPDGVPRGQGGAWRVPRRQREGAEGARLAAKRPSRGLRE